MFSIIEHIEYLLACNDCVVVPGWGAFIANCNQATYDESREVLSHPSRGVGFNPGLTHNDGLLAHSLMRREHLDYDQAMRFIADSVTSFRQQLAMGSEVSMGRLGYMRGSEERRAVEFVPFDTCLSGDRFYGLADVEVKTVAALERELELQQAPAAIVAGRRDLFSRRSTRIAASVAALIGLGVLLTTPVIVNRDHTAMASMAPAVSAPRSQQVGDVTVEQGVVPRGFEVVGASQGIAAVGNTAGKYYMVIATLRNRQELDAFKGKYAALVPYMKLLDYKGMMCVYVARSDDYGQLMGLRDELPEALRDIWIYN